MNTLTKKPKTHIAQVREQQLTQMQQVCRVLGWTAQEYCDHQFEQYELFLAANWGSQPTVLNELRHSPYFRGFWNNDWAYRTDTLFLPFAHEDFEPGTLLEEYLFIHWHSRLVNDCEFMQRYINATKAIRR